MKKTHRNSADLPDCKAGNKRFDKQKRLFLCPIMLSLFLLPAGCESPSLKANKTAPNQTVENEAPPFERDLQTMRTVNFDYIFAFRRRDGGAFDAEDKKYLRTNLPFNNRVLLTDEEKAVIVGSNYKFAPENLEILAKRFNVENFSPKKEETKEAAK